METECLIAIILGAACLLLGLICICQADKRRTTVTPAQVPKALKDAPVQTMPEPPPQKAVAQTPAQDAKVAVAEMQTSPSVTVKLGQWRNAPLDLVVCLDSSASFCLARQPVQPTKAGGQGQDAEIERVVSFMESGTFQRAKGFIGQLATELHLPDVRLGMIRFEDMDEVICPLTEELTDFIKSVQTMSLSPGETKFAPPLRKALEMLKDTNANMEIPGGDWHKPTISKAVLLVTDGDPNDMAETREVAAMFKEANVQLLFVKVGQKEVPDSLDTFAVPWPRPRSANWSGTTELQESKGVFRTAADEPEALAVLIPDILRQVLRAIRPIVRARCNVQLDDYTVASDTEDLSAFSGHEIWMPKHTLPQHSFQVLWDPVLTDPQAYAQEARARLDFNAQLSMAQLQAKQLQQDLQATASLSKTRDGEVGGTGTAVKVEEMINSVANMQQRVDDLCALLPALARKSEELNREKEALRMENEQLRRKAGVPIIDKSPVAVAAPAADSQDSPDQLT